MKSEGRIAFLLQVKNQVGTGLKSAMLEVKDFMRWMSGQQSIESWSKLGDQMLRVGVIIRTLKGATEALNAVTAATRGEWEQMTRSIERIPVLGDIFEFANAVGAATGDYAYTGHQRFKDALEQNKADVAENAIKIRQATQWRERIDNTSRDARLMTLLEWNKEREKAASDRDTLINDARSAVVSGIIGQGVADEAIQAAQARYTATLGEIDRKAAEQAWKAWSGLTKDIQKTFEEGRKRAVDEWNERFAAEQEYQSRIDALREELHQGELDRIQKQFDEDVSRAQMIRELRDAGRAELAKQAEARSRTAPLVEMSNSFRGIAAQFAAGRNFEQAMMRNVEEIRRHVARNRGGGGIAIGLR